jgi:hypothetical protein
MDKIPLPLPPLARPPAVPARGASGWFTAKVRRRGDRNDTPAELTTATGSRRLATATP